MTVCLNCGLATSNPRYCSRSCSVSHNNSRVPKRKRKEWYCKVCNISTTYKRKYCQSCYETVYLYDGTETLGAFRQISGSRNAYHTTVRQKARKAADAAGLLSSCCICGYSLCVQACHLRPVSDFPETALLAEVNSPANLIGLCPNHHWELDNGHLVLSSP